MNKTIPIPSREQVTNLQVSTLLSSLATILPYYRRSGGWKDDDDDSPRTHRTDGGAQMAMENTIVNICDRLDEIMTDQTRWGMESTNTLEKHLAMLYTEHAKTLKLQQQQLYELARPSNRHNPSMFRLRDGSWLAILGRIEDIDNAIVGVGGSPEQALEAFDEMFKGRIPSHLVAWMAARDEAINNNLQPPTKEQYEKELDANRHSPSEGPESTGMGPRSDSRETGPDQKSGGDKAGPSPEDGDSPNGGRYDFGGGPGI